jgi:protein SCO1/2
MAELGLAEREVLQDDAGGAPFRGVLVSVDPERDDTATLAQYVKAFSPRFLGLRGEREPLANFAQQLNATFAKLPDGDGYQVDHTANIVIVNPRGHYAGFIKMPHQADTIAATYRALRETL